MTRPALAALLAAGAACGGGSGGLPHPDDRCPSAAPGDISVTTTSASDAPDGRCDLVEAIRAASTGQPVHGDCPAGGSTPRILLGAGQTYPIAATLRLATGVSIEVCGGGSATISAGASWVADPADASSRCAVQVATPTTGVTLRGITLSQTPGADLAGVCLILGQAEIRGGRVTGFDRGGIVATCDPATGCDHDNLDQSATLHVYNSLVDGNHSSSNGAGVSAVGSGAALIIEHSSIVNNVSAASGGGVFYGAGWENQRISNSTISGNAAQTGGGLSVKFFPCADTYLYLHNDTIANNTAQGTGGGIQFEGDIDPACFPNDINVYSSIVTNNSSTSTAEANINADWNGGHFACSSSSLIYVAPGLPVPNELPPGSPCRFDVPDALLGPLMSMGGTGSLPVHPLLPGSPAIDAAVDGATPDQERDGWIAAVDPPAPDPWTLFDRDVDGDGDGIAVSDLGPYEMNLRWQTELLAVVAKGPGAHDVVTTPTGWDRGAGTSYAGTGATADLVTYALPIAQPGRYGVAVGVMTAANAGRFQLAVADDPSGPWTDVGAIQETYAAASTFAELALTGNFAVDSPGQKYFRFTVAGKNASSAGYLLFLDYITPTKQ